MAVELTYTGQPKRDIPRGITHVFIDGSIDTVPQWTFAGNDSIEEVICHENLKKIEECAFERCPRLTKVVMPGVSVIEDCAFLECPVLTDVECDKLEIVGEAVFAHCESLSSINLSSVRVVRGYAFLNCKALTSAIFSEKLEPIYGLAFANCTSLEQITIPLKAGIITNYIFIGCKMLKHIDLVEGEDLRETVAALQLEEWRNVMNRQIDSINQILLQAPSGSYRADDDYDDEEKTEEIRRWIERVLEKLVSYTTQHRHFLNEAATVLELTLWKKSLHESDQASDGVEGAEESFTCPVKKRKMEAAVSVPARAECRVTYGADINVVIKNTLPFLELPPHAFEIGDGE